MSSWEIYCRQSEVRPEVQTDLYNCLTNGTIVALLLDDSGSMNTSIAPLDVTGFAALIQNKVTRWTELMGDVAQIVQLVTSLNPNGVDVHFMNRPGALNVSDPSILTGFFAAPPSGETPMIGSLQHLFNFYKNRTENILIIVITDGEPSDGNYDQLFSLLVNKPRNFFISFVECNDNEEEMAYLTAWDTRIPRFHNQEDYREELRLVQQVQGPATKFTRANYIQMTVLSPFYPKYSIDMRVRGGKRNPFTSTASPPSYSPSAPPPPYSPSAPPPPPPSSTPPPPPPIMFVSSSGSSAPMTVQSPSQVALPPLPSSPLSSWEAYCSSAEVRPEMKADLFSIVGGNTRFVLLLDDSGSMNTQVSNPENPSAPRLTRWQELMGDTAGLLQLLLSTNPANGVNVRFMNRPGIEEVRDPAQLAPLFNSPPSGSTPMIRCLSNIFQDYSSLNQKVLLILITDGEPSDGSYQQLFNLLLRKPQNFFVSFVECNDNEEEMDYLTSWDSQIPRFHNQEDYREELRLVRRMQGASYKFTRANYMQMTVLSPFYPRYRLDMRRGGGGGFLYRQGQSSLKYYTDGPPRLSFWIAKQGQIVPTWKRRFFILDGGFLSYFADEQCAFYKGEIGVILHAVQSSSSVFVSLASASRTLRLQFSTQEQVPAFLAAYQQHRDFYLSHK